MRLDVATALLDRLHRAQNDLYAGGSGAGLDGLLADDVRWTVPGESRIAGSYVGRKGVLGYFRERSALASNSLVLTRRDVLVGSRGRIAALTDGAARIDALDRRWSTIGLYEVADERIRSCRLLPFDQAEFDAAWGD